MSQRLPNRESERARETSPPTSGPAVGYGVRAAQALRSEAIPSAFIGCKDGTITRVDVHVENARRGKATSPLASERFYAPAKRTAGGAIAALCPRDRLHVIVGCADGSIEEWTLPEKTATERNTGALRAAEVTQLEQGDYEGRRGVSMVGRLRADDDLYFVSWRSGRTAIYSGLSSRAEDSSPKEWTAVWLPSPSDPLICIVARQVAPDQWIVVDATGRIATLTYIAECNWHLLAHDDSDVYRYGAPPMVVWDYAGGALRAGAGEFHDTLMLATDTGVWELNCDQPHEPHATPLHLPGFSGTCNAIALQRSVPESVQSAPREDGSETPCPDLRSRWMLFANDDRARAHLYEQCLERTGWTPLYTMNEHDIHVVRALGFPYEGGMYVVLAGHNSEARLMQYSFRHWIHEADNKISDPLDMLERSTPERLLGWLSAPDAEPFVAALRSDPANAAASIQKWTRALLGLVHRTQPLSRHRDACDGILRWLHRLRTDATRAKLANLPRLRRAIADGAADVSRYGINAFTYEQRVSALVPLQTLDGDDLLAPLAIDRFAYQSRLVARRFDILARTRVSLAEQEVRAAHPSPDSRAPATSSSTPPARSHSGVDSIHSEPAPDGPTSVRSSGMSNRRSKRDGLPLEHQKLPRGARASAIWYCAPKPCDDAADQHQANPRESHAAELRPDIDSRWCWVATSWQRASVTLHRLVQASRGAATPLEFVREEIEIAAGLSEVGRCLVWAPLENGEADLIVAGSETDSDTAAYPCVRLSRCRLRVEKGSARPRLVAASAGSIWKESDVPIPGHAGECAYSFCWCPREKRGGTLFVGLRGVKRVPRVVRLERDDNGDWLENIDVANDLCNLLPPFPAGEESVDNPVLAFAYEKDRLFAGCHDGQIWEIDWRKGETPIATPIARMTAPISAMATKDDRIFVGTSGGTIAAWQRADKGSGTTVRDWIPIWATEEFGRLKGDAVKSIHAFDNVVVATVEDGECVLFVNDVGAVKDDCQVSIPGDRLDRISLSQTIFASPLVPSDWLLAGARHDWVERFGLRCAIAVGGEQGNLQCISIHYPRRSRRKPHLQLSTLVPSEIKAESYLPEAISVVAPYAEHVLLWKREDIVRRDDQDIEGEAPMYLRGAYATLRQLQYNAVDWSEAPVDSWRKELTNSLESITSYQRRFRLFRLIVQRALEETYRAIDNIFGSDTKPQVGAAKRVYDWYESLVDDLLELAGAFAGGSLQRQLNEQLCVLRALNDDRGVRVLTVAAARHADLDVRRHAADILDVYTNVVRRMFLHGDALVILETMRSINLTLMSGIVESPQMIDGVAMALPRHIDGYLHLVADFACRTADGRSALSYACRFEAARAFAVALAMYPKLPIHIAFRLAEAGLHPSLTTPVVDQLEALDILGCWPSPSCRKSIESYFRRGLLEVDEPSKGAPSHEEVEVLTAGPQVNKVLHVLATMEGLSSALESDARGVSTAALDFIAAVREVAAEKEDSPIRHSAAFWASRGREGVWPELALADGREFDVGVIRFSFDLRKWASDGVGEVERLARTHELFDPNVGKYRTGLRRLEEASRAFPAGAAVQAALVRGGLEHHVNEELDNDAFRLRSIAHAMSPLTPLEDGIVGGQRVQTGATRFERDQRESAAGAEAVADTIRTIYATAGWRNSGTKESAAFAEFAERAGWKYPGVRGVMVTDPEAAALGVLFNQLQRNHEIHYLALGGADTPELTIDGDDVILSFPLIPRDEPKGASIRDRLKQLHSHLAHTPVAREESRPSNGLGLHLGAASVARAGLEFRVRTPCREIATAKTLDFAIRRMTRPPLRISQAQQDYRPGVSIHPRPGPAHEKRVIIVVDDAIDFPIHVWTHLSGRLRVGGAQSLAEDIQKRLLGPTTDEPFCFSSHDGSFCVWWVRAHRRTQDVIQKLRARLRSKDEHVLLDQRVVRTSHEDGAYQPLKLKEQLKDERFTVSLVSSYVTGTSIKPKSIPSLVALRKELWWPHESPWPPMRHASLPNAIHILVTGAGFELCDRVGGFGMPPTATIIQELVKSARREKIFADPEIDAPGPFPLPAFLYELSDETRIAYSNHPANEAKEFDEWWNRILLALIGAISKSKGPVGDDYASRRALDTEIQLRSLFRHELLKSDWNHLEQCIYASVLPFDGWLSTNYTHFADRAIHAAAAAQHLETRTGSALPWEIAASGSEAMRLASDAMHPRKRGESPPYRVLFKLHGDIARVDTMTLAGLDKEAASPFHIRLDALHPLYIAARSYVAAQLQRKERARLVLHIVGHALRDSMLNRLIADIIVDARRLGRDVEWRRVDCHAEATSQLIGDALSKGLRDEQHADLEEAIVSPYGFPTTAARYLATWERTLRHASPSSPFSNQCEPVNDDPEALANLLTLDPADIEHQSFA